MWQKEIEHTEFLILLALDIQIYTKYIHTLNSPRLQPPSLEKTFYATYAYYDGDQRTSYACVYLFREM